MANPRTDSRMLVACTTLLAAALCGPAPALAASSAAPWAQTAGAAAWEFQSHELGHDGAQGPNGTFAVGRWSGNDRKGTYAGFALPDPSWQPTLVRVVLHGYVSAPVESSSVDVFLNTAGGRYGPLHLNSARLSRQLGAAAADAWVVDFSAAYAFPPGSLQGAVEVEIRLLRRGPEEGAELYLDAVGLQVVMENPAETFDLWAGQDASALAAGAPWLVDVAAPVDLAAPACPGDPCFVLVTDSTGASRPLSVLLLSDGQTMRVGFVDGREDAPVDPGLSLVSAAAQAPADGATALRVLVTPCDGSGELLGEGIALRLDPALLGPAEALGSFVHQGDGTYALDLVAAAAGTAVLAVEADGVPLDSAPQVEFLTP